jgi:hypothetical protein
MECGKFYRGESSERIILVINEVTGILGNHEKAISPQHCPYWSVRCPHPRRLYSCFGGTLVLADNAGLKFVVTDASSNRLSSTSTVTLDGYFTIDTSAVTTVMKILARIFSCR